MIKLSSLTKVYETVNYNIIAVSNADYKLDKGEVVVLLGKSGSGKSTLLNILGGFDTDYAGSYYFGDKNIKELPDNEIDAIRREKIGFVFQNYALLENLTIVKNVELALDVIGVVDPKRKRAAALRALNFVGLHKHADKRPSQLSGGQKQRVAIARAFVKNPDVIIADEPTAALDSQTSVEILDLLSSLCKNKLLIIATHNKSIVRDYGTRVIEMKSGYTVRDELVLPDKSNIEVDDLDLIVDKELGIEATKKKVEASEQEHADAVSSRILQDLGLEGDDFKVNINNEFEIDDELKKEIIENRIDNEKGTTRVTRFSQKSLQMVGKKKYARSSFRRYFVIHAFTIFLILTFMLSVILGLNFVNQVFRGFNEKTNMMNQLQSEAFVIQFDTDEEYNLLESYEDYETLFISDFSHEEVSKNEFITLMMQDPSFRIKSKLDKMLYLSNYLDSKDREDDYNILYNDANFLLKSDYYGSTDFDTFNVEYENLSSTPYYDNRVTEFMGKILDTNLLYQYNYIFSEGNEDVLNKHLVTGGKLPTGTDEVVIPISLLFEHDIIVDDADINAFTDSKVIWEKFKELPESSKKISLRTHNINLDNAAGDTTITSNGVQEFTVVGLLNVTGDLNPYYEPGTNSLISNLAPDNFSFLFSKDALENVSYTISDTNTLDDVEIVRTPMYFEMDKTIYEDLDINKVLTDYEESYRDSVGDSFATSFNVYRDILRTAQELIFTEIDTNSKGSGDPFFTSLIDNGNLPGVTYKDLRNEFFVKYFIGSRDKYLETVCSSCDKERADILANADSIHDYLIANNTDSTVIKIMESLGNVNKLGFQQAANTLVWNEYKDELAPLLNRTDASETIANIEYNYNYEEEISGLKGIIAMFIPLEFLALIPYGSTVLTLIDFIEESAVYELFMYSTGLDLIITSVTSNAIQSLIIVSALVITYTLLTVSLVLLCIVMANLFGNVYERAAKSRRKEIGNLRLLGATYDDIKEVLNIESKRVYWISLALIVSSLVGMYYMSVNKRFLLFGDVGSVHYYIPVMNMYFDINFYSLGRINIIILFLSALIFRFYVYNILIKKISLKKVQDINDLDAIKFGDE